jgi:hypothetical protein
VVHTVVEGEKRVALAKVGGGEIPDHQRSSETCGIDFLSGRFPTINLALSGRVVTGCLHAWSESGPGARRGTMKLAQEELKLDQCERKIVGTRPH